MATEKNSPSKRHNLEENSIENFITKDFKANIEKEFFCELGVKFSKQTHQHLELILEMNFNFDLEQGLPILAQKKIGSLHLNQSADFLFLNQLAQVLDNDTKTVDIEELNIVFTDCSFVIHSIYVRSIPHQIEELVQKIYENQVYFTKGFSAIPYEIHIPVLEEKPVNIGLNITPFKPKQIDPSDYVHFWALYFDDNIEAVIYDVLKQEIFSSELVMVK